MNPYDRLRGGMGYPVDYELGRMLSTHTQERGKLVYAAAKSYVVKLVCQRVGNDGALEDCGFFNGFFYHDTEPLVLTTKHILGFGGAVKYIAKYYEGTMLQGEAECRLKKASAFEDVLLFTCDNVPPHPMRPLARVCCVGDVAYVVGFKGRAEPQLSFADGVVSYVGMREMTVTSHADNGFSGCPVFDMDGFLIGMVQGGQGQTIWEVIVVPSATIDAFLQMESPPAPGLRDKL